MLALSLALNACVNTFTPPTTAIRHVEIDSAFYEWFGELRDQQTAERVLCIYGAVRNDTAWVNFVKPAKMEARTETYAKYDGCPRPRIFSPIAQYLGTWHGHKVDSVTWDDLCRFSQVDTKSFEADKHALIELLSCRGTLMARGR